MGIVSFKPEAEMVKAEANYEYRTDTDVITSILLRNNGERSITPDDNCAVAFEILGETYYKEFVCPAGEEQLVWMKWHTPKKPCVVEINVSARGVRLSSIITANVVELSEATPPDPKYGDSNSSFRLEKTPDYGSCTEAAWKQWIAIWIPPVGDTPGHWAFIQKDYAVTLSAKFELEPDSRVQTAEAYADGWEIKSGYGINAECKTSVKTSGPVSFDTDYTQVQTEVATFSDFGFKTYNRLLEPEQRLKTSTTWHFKENINSYYLNRVHFTPLWYPDDTDYVVALSVFDAWTPVGMLYTTADGSVHIDGNVYDDWYIRLMK